MVKIKDGERCRECNGVGLTRNDDPMSDRVYGSFCSYCDGTGMASDPVARRYAAWLFIVLNVLFTIIAWYWWRS